MQLELSKSVYGDTIPAITFKYKKLVVKGEVGLFSPKNNNLYLGWLNNVPKKNYLATIEFYFWQQGIKPRKADTDFGNCPQDFGQMLLEIGVSLVKNKQYLTGLNLNQDLRLKKNNQVQKALKAVNYFFTYPKHIHHLLKTFAWHNDKIQDKFKVMVAKQQKPSISKEWK